MKQGRFSSFSNALRPDPKVPGDLMTFSQSRVRCRFLTHFLPSLCAVSHKKKRVASGNHFPLATRPGLGVRAVYFFGAGSFSLGIASVPLATPWKSPLWSAAHGARVSHGSV